MHVQTLTMDPRIARIHYGDYMNRCRKHRADRKAKRDEQAKHLGKEMRRLQIEKTRMEKEDTQLLLAYKALLKAGTRLIHLPNVIRDGGFDKAWLPKLAVARASAKQVTFWPGNNPYFEGSPWEHRVDHRVKITPNVFPAEVRNTEWREGQRHPNKATALVPAVPPHLRPDDLTKYHILWEAEWSFQAPGDPILLSQVNDDMYAIVAQWDLTPLEQRILESRSL
jgi:hypothetical protein